MLVVEGGRAGLDARAKEDEAWRGNCANQAGPNDRVKLAHFNIGAHQIQIGSLGRDTQEALSIF